MYDIESHPLLGADEVSGNFMGAGYMVPLEVSEHVSVTVLLKLLSVCSFFFSVLCGWVSPFFLFADMLSDLKFL